MTAAAYATALLEAGFAIHESPGEPNLFHATSPAHPNNWLLAIQINGELMPETQRELMVQMTLRTVLHDELVGALERIKKHLWHEGYEERGGAYLAEYHALSAVLAKAGVQP